MEPDTHKHVLSSSSRLVFEWQGVKRMTFALFLLGVALRISPIHHPVRLRKHCSDRKAKLVQLRVKIARNMILFIFFLLRGRGKFDLSLGIR
ncbi:hypothetical protein E2C01_053714 [Portunus trituberculatus]|uniref:Uncharacterized protein n=1 Tax=Portunus trituberculatus TaxID=210409 RepID=A0A5B7GRK0_PORTR|nr:hypothetical protein [Portunus trituberculatus]